MKATLFLATLVSVFLSGNTKWYSDFAEAKTAALEKKANILVNFAGSDWCTACIRMEKQVFETPAFENYASDHLILVRADFPRLKKNQLPVAQQQKNDALAEKYNPNGYFPYTVLLNANGKVLRNWEGFYDKGADAFLEEIKAVNAQ